MVHIIVFMDALTFNYTLCLTILGINIKKNPDNRIVKSYDKIYNTPAKNYAHNRNTDFLVMI